MQILVNTDRNIEGSAKLTDEVETVVQQALSRFSDQITRVEVYLSDENSSQKHGGLDKRCVIEVRLGGLQPITVSHLGAWLEEAVSGAAQKLEKTLKRTLGRKESIFKRRVRERAALVAAAPLLQHDAETGKQEDFFKVLRPLLGHLGHHARRELRIMEADGSLFPGQVVLGDLLDEVVTRAWLQFAGRPSWLALDLWLTKILDDILEETIDRDQRKPSSLGDGTGELLTQNVPQVDDQEWWVWLLGEGDTAPQENTIPSRTSTWAEEYLEVEDLLDRIHAALGDLPKLQRQAFVHHVLEAYNLHDVAMLQNRPQAEVRSDIDAARGLLRVRLSADAGSPSAGYAEALAGSTELN